VKIYYHPAVERDIADALHHYDSISPTLGNEFLEELRHFIRLAATHPRKFHPVSPKFRRVNLRRFPYHFLFREISGGIRITLVRHHKRHPDHGMERR